MPKFSKSSLRKLNTCHPDLITLFIYVVQHFDCKILCGHRTISEQFKLYKQGRKLINKKWTIVNKRNIVTYKDGKNNKSKHNFNPSLAVDVISYPIPRWKDLEIFYYFAGFVKGYATMLKAYGAIENNIIFGGDWDDDTNLYDQTFMDLVHFQIK